MEVFLICAGLSFFLLIAACWNVYSLSVRLYILEKNFDSFTDFTNNKISELEGAAEFWKFSNECYEYQTQTYIKLFEQFDFNLKCLQYDYYCHMKDLVHLNEQLKVNQPTSIVKEELELKLITLENSIRQAAQQHNIALSLKPRPKN